MALDTVHMETLDKHFKTLAKAAFARHGFASEQLISQWEAVVGPEIGQFCLPDKIKWPQSAGETARKSGGTLVLRASQGRALELQYQIPRIIERVNQFLGYGAITERKVVQGHTVTKPAKAAPVLTTPEAAVAWESRIDDISDDELKAALVRLAAHAAPNGPKSTSPQEKLGIGLKPQTQLGK
jgi:hypothetical protein